MARVWGVVPLQDCKGYMDYNIKVAGNHINEIHDFCK